jgi:nucleoredoxin
MLELLGDKLLSSSGNVMTVEALKGKAVGLYFSVHWCPPCRGFTPKLTQVYKSLKASGKELEIVFVSSDRDEAAFQAYFKEMPWLALQFSDRSIKSKLSAKYGVSGIPALIILDADANVATANGRSAVMQDPTGQWVPSPKLPAKLAITSSKPSATSSAVNTAPSAAVNAPSAAGTGLAGLLGLQPLLDTDGKTAVELAAVVGDAPLIGLYFSAHWCGPCRSFTPKLKAFVEALKDEKDVKLPIIFGSSDREMAAFDSYFTTMPWHAFPFSDSDQVEVLKKRFGVSGIPWLVVLDAQGNLILNEADTEVSQGPQAYKRWLATAKASTQAATPAASAA